MTFATRDGNASRIILHLVIRTKHLGNSSEILIRCVFVATRSNERFHDAEEIEECDRVWVGGVHGGSGRWYVRRSGAVAGRRVIGGG